MRITSLHIENFRAIRLLTIHSLTGSVVIAGPNGCGKSSVFDAVRLLKSAYGQYVDNEWQSWFSEFQLSATGIGSDVRRVLFDSSRGSELRFTLALSESEKSYLQSHGHEIIQQMNWKRRVPNLGFISPV